MYRKSLCIDVSLLGVAWRSDISKHFFFLLILIYSLFVVRCNSSLLDEWIFSCTWRGLEVALWKPKVSFESISHFILHSLRLAMVSTARLHDNISNRIFKDGYVREINTSSPYAHTCASYIPGLTYDIWLGWNWCVTHINSKRPQTIYIRRLSENEKKKIINKFEVRSISIRQFIQP